jgi:competence protein ComEA
MTLYTRHQLLVALLVVGAAGAGLALDHWRRARPDLADRLELLDRDEALSPAPSRYPPRSRADTAPCPQEAGPRGRARAEPDREPRPPAAPLDVNRATEAELVRLPGIGPALASRIVAARPFLAVDEMRRVRGLRRVTLDRLRPLVTASSPAPHQD